MNRRNFLFKSLLSASGLVLAASEMDHLLPSAFAKPAASGAVTIILFDNSGKKLNATQVQKVVKSADEWKKHLTRDQYEVTRNEGTERAFSGEYWNLHDKGIYRCICCDNALFKSDTKFESGTGWPSFWAPIAKENVRSSTDSSLGMDRTAVSCTQCDAHLGHVFPDGPLPTGLRYCMNSLAMKFVKTM